MHAIYRIIWGSLIVVSLICPVIGNGQTQPGDMESAPRVGLVLSGGGARGFAHIGVLKVLEEVGMPVDYVVGTSMGSVVGGLYASGYSAAEIDRIVTEVDWEDIFTDTPPRNLWSYQKKKASARYILGVEFTRKGFIVPRGFTAGQKISNLLAFLTLRVSDIDNFDNLPIPYRAVAADIVTGAEVVIDHGLLADAMRASMAVPGVFTPITLHEHLLVDGGVVKNLPVDVAKAMGADIIIAVDISSPLKGVEALGNPLSILNQMISLQIFKSTEEQRKMADLLIVGELGDLSSTDFGKGPELIAAGEQSARAQIQAIRALADRVKALRPKGRSVIVSSVLQDAKTILVQDIVVEGVTTGEEQLLIKQLQEQKGQPLNPELLEQTITEIFSTGKYETVKFTLLPNPAEGKTLKLQLQERNQGAHQLRVGMNYEGHFNDAEEDKMILLVNVVLNNLTNGSSWATELQFVNTFKVESEYIQPLGKGFYFAPKFFLSEDFQTLYDQKKSVARYNTDDLGFELRFGTFIRRFGELSFGYRFERVDVAPTATVLTATFPEFQETVAGFFLRSRLDLLDTFPFPTSGRLFTMDYWAANERFASDVNFHRLLLEYWRYWAIRQRSTLGLHLQLGTDFKTDLRQYQHFRFGGPDSFAGYKIDELTGSQLGVVALEYRYQLYQLPSAVGGGIWGTLTANVGNVWQTITAMTEDFSLRYGGSLGLGVDTLLGPVRADFALADGGRKAIYLNIGYPLQ